MESWTSVAVFIDLVRQILALCNGKALSGEEVRLACKQADAIHLMPLRLAHQRPDQFASAAFALGPRRHRDRTNLSQMGSVKVQCPAANDAPVVFENDEVVDVLTDL